MEGTLQGNFIGNVLTVNLGDQKVDLDVEEKLGEGAFASVLRAVDNRGVSFAIKNVVCHNMDTYESIAQEVGILLKLNHANIVRMYGFDWENNTSILIMEYCSQGTLNRKLDRAVDFMVQLQWMEQLGSALLYLHNNNIVHRDLKTENILLSENNVKIADFGIARHFVCCRSGRIDYDPNTYISEYLQTYMGTFAGTPYWVAPEVFDNNYTEKADIFSLGVIFYAICERQFIMFEGEKYYGAFVQYKGRDTGIGLVMFEQQQSIDLPFHRNDNRNLVSAIRSMVRFNPDKRISLMKLREIINETHCQQLLGENDCAVTENREPLIHQHVLDGFSDEENVMLEVDNRVPLLDQGGKSDYDPRKSQEKGKRDDVALIIDDDGLPDEPKISFCWRCCKYILSCCNYG